MVIYSDMKRYFSLLCVLALLAGCYNTDEQLINEQIPSDGRIFTASFEQNDTRTYVEEGNLLRWNEGDQITIFDSNTLNQQYQFDGETGDNGGTFSKVSNSFGTGNDLNCHYAVYPYNKDIKITETGVITANLPAEQSYAKNSFGLGANTMVAVTKDVDDTFLKFRNVGGYLKLQLYGENVTVKSITLTGNDNEKLAGKATVTPAYGQSPTIVMSDDATTSITLDCGDGVKVGATEETATAFWIVMPPTTFEEGLTITVTEVNGESFTKSTSNAVVVERNIIKPMAAFEVVCVLPQTFEIAYTTNDGEPLDPYTTEGFGANFIENIYNAETGEGSLKFDGKIVSIPEKAFVSCTNLTKINLTFGITAINDEAFSNCYNLTIMDIPEGVISIGNKAFFNCNGVTDITIPSSITSIGTSSFEGCGGNAYINCTIPGISSLFGTEGKFYNAQFTSVILNDGVTSIGSYAFCSCRSLTNVTISDSVTSIGKFAFSGCKSLISAKIGDGVISIDDYAFNECTSLKNLKIGDSVILIGDYAFSTCKSLTSVIIPDNVNTIGYYTFEYCDSIASVTIGKGVAEIGWDAFSSCKLLKEVHYTGDLSAWCKIKFTTSSNPMFNGAKLYLNGTELIEAIIPSDITVIKENTFYGCTSLTSVTISKRVTSIEFSAFYGCTSLKKIYCNQEIPPLGNYRMFDNVAPDCKIYVPLASVDIYKTANYWSDYAAYIEGYDF